MAHSRLQNLLTGLAIGAVFGVTAWSLAAREPGLFSPQGPGMPEAMQPATLPAAAPVRQGPGASESRVTEQMLERGALSHHPARFYRKEAP